jgi:hypothetical protein
MNRRNRPIPAVEALEEQSFAWRRPLVPDEPGEFLDEIDFQVNGLGEDRAGLQRKIDLLTQVIRFMKA